MKNFEELTQEELSTLTNEQIDRYIDIRCAENGIPLMPEKPITPEEDDYIEPDTWVFVVGDKWAFTEREDAEKVVDAVQKAPSLVYFTPEDSWKNKPGQITETKSKSYNALDIKVDIEKSQAYSAEQYVAVKNQIERYNGVMSEYKEAKKTYDESFESRKQYIDEVWEIVNEAIAGQREIAKAKENFEKYLLLADGNEEMAEKFLFTAYPDAEITLYPNRFDENGDRICVKEVSE